MNISLSLDSQTNMYKTMCWNENILALLNIYTSNIPSKTPNVRSTFESFFNFFLNHPLTLDNTEF